MITDVDGITVGNAEDQSARTGVTVILPIERAVASGEVRGAAPGTRETDLLDPTCSLDRIDGVCFSGGSVHGLASSDAVVRWLHARERGFSLNGDFLPIIPGAVIYDLPMGGEKDWGRRPNYGELAGTACDNAGLDFPLGNIGAGMGAFAGPLKAGLGSASAVCEDRLQVGALVVTNPFGTTTIPGSGTLWAWTLERDGEMGGQHAPGPANHEEDRITIDRQMDGQMDAQVGGNTTLAVIATNATLDKAQAKRVAMMAHDGMARAIRPIHTPFDGDVVFTLSTTRMPLPEANTGAVARIGAIAADCLTRAIGRSVFEAAPLGNFASYRETYGEAFAAGKKPG